MSYNDRKQRGNEFEKEVAEYHTRHGYTVTRCGVEETHNKEFVKLMVQHGSPLSRFVRNQPDGYAINDSGVMFAWDAKIGLNISRDAWETYQHVSLIGPLFVFFKTPTNVMSGEIKSIELEHGSETTSGFGHDAYPVDSDGWISPRLAQYIHGAGSGSPYKKVRVLSLDPVTDWINAK